MSKTATTIRRFSPMKARLISNRGVHEIREDGKGGLVAWVHPTASDLAAGHGHTEVTWPGTLDDCLEAVKAGDLYELISTKG